MAANRKPRPETVRYITRDTWRVAVVGSRMTYVSADFHEGSLTGVRVTNGYTEQTFTPRPGTTASLEHVVDLLVTLTEQTLTTSRTPGINDIMAATREFADPEDRTGMPPEEMSPVRIDPREIWAWGNQGTLVRIYYHGSQDRPYSIRINTRYYVREIRETHDSLRMPVPAMADMAAALWQWAANEPGILWPSDMYNIIDAHAASPVA